MGDRNRLKVDILLRQPVFNSRSMLLLAGNDEMGFGVDGGKFTEFFQGAAFVGAMSEP